MSTATLPQLQVLLDNAHSSFSAPTPPNSASTNSSDSPDSAKTPVHKSPKRSTISISPSTTPSTALVIPNSTTTTSPSTTCTTDRSSKKTQPEKEKEIIPSPLSQIKPPPIPRPWSWQCHRCYSEYKVSCTRRCFECGHEFCSANNNTTSKRGPCRSQFDFAGWEAWGAFRRTVSCLRRLESSSSMSSSGGGVEDVDYTNKRRRKGDIGTDLEKEKEKEISWAARDTFATWTPATNVIHDPRKGWISTISKTDPEATSMPWTPVTSEERDRIMKKKEKMYVRREYNCYLHCDAPSECRLAVYTACFEGRARLVGNGRLMAVLLEDINADKKKNGKKRGKKRKEMKKKAVKLVSKLVDSEDEEDSEGEEEGGDKDKECVIMRKLKKKKNQLLHGTGTGTGSGGGSSGRERRLSGEIITEHVEDRQAEFELPAGDSILREQEEERTTSVPRQVVWPSSGDGEVSVSDSTKPRGLLATLINGTAEEEVDLRSLPFVEFEKTHQEDNEPEAAAEFAELVRVSSNLAQATGHITSNSDISQTSLVSPPAASTTFQIISIDDADQLVLSAGLETGYPANGRPRETSVLGRSPSNCQSPEQTEGFVDLKEVVNMSNLENHKRKRRQRSEHSQVAEDDHNDILSPSPQGITFRFPIWNDIGGKDNDDTAGYINDIVSEYSAADLMDILDGSSESQSSNSNSVRSASSSPSPASSASASADGADTYDNGNGTSLVMTIPGITTSPLEKSASASARGISPPPVSPISPNSQQQQQQDYSFSPVSPIDPERKMNNDLSMYMDDEIISPVSIAAARTLNSLAAHTTTGGTNESHHHQHHHEKEKDDTDKESACDEGSGTGASKSRRGSGSGSRNIKGSEHQCEVLLTLRKMQSAFMGGRQQGRHW